MKQALSYDDVAQAATHLHSKNERPTARAIRLIVGRGSFGTLTRYLNEWREKSRPSTPFLPEESLSSEIKKALLQEIARHLQKSGQEKNEEISRLASDLQEALTENDRLEALCAEQGERIEGLSQEDIRKTERATLLGASLEEEKTRAQSLLSRLHEAEKTIARLEVRLETSETLLERFEQKRESVERPASSNASKNQRRETGSLTKRGKFMTLSEEPDMDKPASSSENRKGSSESH